MSRKHRQSSTIIGAIAAVAALAAVALLVYAVTSAGASDGDPQGVYISLGDSVAAGSGASDPATTSFPALIAQGLGLRLSNVATAGATTVEVNRDQVPRILPLLDVTDVRLITISVGGNDLAALIPNAACVDDPLPDSCPLESHLRRVSTGVRQLLGVLREAAPDVPIVLLGYPNFFSGTGHAWEAPAGRVLPQLVDWLQMVASEHDRVEVALPSFDGRGGELTHVNDEDFDPHPNDAGHRVIADAMLAALAKVEA
jgi:lysophospholipase L1-like esterase